MANTTIKITQLQNIGNGLAANTLLPVVNTTGTAITQKVTVGNVANFALSQAGNTLAPAFLANLAYSVVNAAQPNITSVGTLNVNTLKISGGTNGYVLQTNGSGNLSWVAQSGSGNGSPGGSNSQLQFNLGGSFAGDPELTWDAGNNQLNTVNFAASSATIYGNVNAINVNASGNIRPNAIYTDHYYYANGYVFGGGGGNGDPGGTDTQIQFNDNGVFGGNTGFTFDKVTGILSSPFLVGSGNGLSNIQGANISGAVATATYATNVAGANVSGEVTFAGTANSVAVANVVGIGNIATLSLDGSTSNVLYGNGVFAPVAGGNGTYGNAEVATFLAAFGSNTITTTGNVTVGNLILNGTPVQAIGTITPVTGNVVLGANVTLTGTTSANATTIMSVALPSAGTWQVTSVINGLGGGVNSSGWTISFGLYNASGTLVTDSEVLITRQQTGTGSSAQGTGTGVNIISTAGPETYTIRAWGTDLTQAIDPSIVSDTNGKSYATFVKLDPAATISTTANVTFGNVTADNIGNIATINLDGNVSNVLNGNGAFVAIPVINANTVIWSTAPVANTSTGTPGQAAYDSGGNLYVCVSTNTWSKFTGTTSW